MSVEKMKLLSITGREENIDMFIEDYLLDSGLQTEDAVKVFEKGWNLTNFKYDSTARELSKSCKAILDKYKIKYIEDQEAETMKYTLEDLKKEFETIKENFEYHENYIKEKKEELAEYEKKSEVIKNTKDLDINFDEFYNLEYVRFRYGKILKENLGKLENSLRELNALVIKAPKVEEDDKYEYVFCITTSEQSAKVDSYLNLFKFERYTLPQNEELSNPKDIWNKYEDKILEVSYNIEEKEAEFSRIVDRDAIELVDLYYRFNLYVKINNVKKYMAYDENGLFYIIGWIPAKELTKILPKLSKDKELKYVVKNHDEVASIPPTKLKNNKFIKPFETIVKMYGLPNYTEIDPTLFVALTAFFLFGFMFGDVGHGLVIFLIGFLMARKKQDFGPIFEAGGISSMIFGVLYGSVFGAENIIPALFIRPMENIQTMLIYGITVGVGLIVFAMVLNIQNGIKTGNKKKAFFDTNGIAGLFFYLIILSVGVFFLLRGRLVASLGVLSIFVILPLISIMFKDFLAEKIFKEKTEEKTSLAEKLFSVVEILLSFASNTISFVRIAAFAINHVGLCMAVTVLSQMTSGSKSTLILVAGNAIVIVLEGLIVGIQVLRLEYYELFSRFYAGDGKEYKPLREKI